MPMLHLASRHCNTKRHNITKPPAVYSITNSHLASETFQYKEMLQYKATSNLLHHQLTLGFNSSKQNTKRHYVSTKSPAIYSITNSHLASETFQYKETQQHKATSNLLHHHLTFGFRDTTSTIQRDTTVQSHQQFTLDITNSQSHLASETLQYKVKETLQYNTTKPPTVYSITNSQFCLHCPVPG